MNAFEEILDELKSLPKGVKAIVPVIISAILAYYVPILLVSLFGIWRNLLWIPAYLLAGIAIFAVQGIIMVLTKRPKLVGLVLAIAWTIFYVVFTARIKTWAGWQSWWPIFVSPGLATLFQGVILEKLEAVMGLLPPAKSKEHPAAV